MTRPATPRHSTTAAHAILRPSHQTTPQPAGGMPIVNACTIDVEDYFQVSNFAHLVSRGDWDRIPLRLRIGTEKLLATLDHHGVRATFFILGWIAERCPDLVRRIVAGGHEVGCHSHEHRLVYDQSRTQFRKDLRRSKQAIEDAAGVAVRSYRAPSFSITKHSIDRLAVLVEEGFTTDSSVFPVLHDRYGMPNAPLTPFRIQTASGPLTEVPGSVINLGRLRLPVGGGGYFRLYPYRFTSRCIRRLNAVGRPVNFYVHPWEFDPDQPRMPGISRTTRFRHYVGLANTSWRFSHLLRDHAFGTLDAAVKSYHSCQPETTYRYADGCFLRVESLPAKAPVPVPLSLPRHCPAGTSLVASAG